MSRDNRLDFIRHYIRRYDDETEDGETIYGGYGPRIFHQRGEDQLKNVIALLTRSADSRRAVIQLFNAEDIAQRHEEVPCTCTLQFLRRRNRLHMLTTMRSNDAYIGLPHDIFCFTMLQEVVARTLGVRLGTYKHFVGSLHLYDDDRDEAQQYVNEGAQATVAMPQMPRSDPRASIQRLLDAEYRIRHGDTIDANKWGVTDYWADLIRLLQIHAARGNKARTQALKDQMVSPNYATYIDRPKLPLRPPRVPKKTYTPPRQLPLPL
jgi:thymidylate synthase